MKAKIRKIATFVEETYREMEHKISPPTRKAAALAVIDNPCAGKYVEDMSELMAIGEELGELLTARAVAALGIPGPSAESYGKAAAVGENGELEHAAAILHPETGDASASRAWQGGGINSVVEKTRGPRRGARHPAGPQGRGICAQPFRRHGSEVERRSPRE